jgi:hypothetical protein
VTHAQLFAAMRLQEGPRICRHRDDRNSWRRPRTRRSRWSWARVRRHTSGLGAYGIAEAAPVLSREPVRVPGSVARSSAAASAGDSRSRPPRRSSSGRTVHPV